MRRIKFSWMARQRSNTTSRTITFMHANKRRQHLNHRLLSPHPSLSPSRLLLVLFLLLLVHPLLRLHSPNKLDQQSRAISMVACQTSVLPLRLGHFTWVKFTSRWLRTRWETCSAKMALPNFAFGGETLPASLISTKVGPGLNFVWSRWEFEPGLCWTATFSRVVP